MKFKKLESGRSMVEMLGVLAIIGVLSVGGIAGYSLSMRRHRANQIVDYFSKSALVIYNNCQQKILNNEIESIDACWGYGADGQIAFEEAGVGSLPASVTGIYSWAIYKDYYKDADYVNINIIYADQKICQAVASISGSTCGENDSILKIYQN